MKKSRTVHVYADPSHAWGKVLLPDLQWLNIADKISSCSYVRGNYAYLEEDCDLPLYLRTLKGHGYAYKFVEHCARERMSKIRSYAPYSASSY